MIKVPFVSIVVPVKNEGEHISTTIGSILDQDYPKDRIEIIIADGMSTDSTRTDLQILTKKQSNITIIDNPEGIVSTGLNRAIQQTKGDIIIRMDFHASYPKDYVSLLVNHIKELDADNVGGSIVTVPWNSSKKAQAIAISMSNRFGVGNSYFRIGTSAPREVDTVPFGCFKHDVFGKIGLFDEDLVRNQDDEFNGRMKRNGMKIWLIPDVVVTYYARANYIKLFRMFYQYGYFKPLVAYKLGSPATLRQFVPLVFFLFILSGLLIPFFPLWALFYSVTLCVYVTVSFFYSRLATKNNLVCVMAMYAHFVQHIAYGIGYLMGITDLLVLQRRFQKNIPLTR